MLEEATKLSGEQATRKTDLQKLEEQIAKLQKSENNNGENNNGENKNT